MFHLLIILANSHGYIQSLLNPVLCLFFAHFKNFLNANLIVKSNLSKPIGVGSIGPFTPILQILAFNIESLALILSNKMDMSNENTITLLKWVSPSYPTVMFLIIIGITLFSWPHILLITFLPPPLACHHLKNSTIMLLIFHP